MFETINEEKFNIDKLLNNDWFIEQRVKHGPFGIERVAFMKKNFSNIIESIIPLADFEILKLWTTDAIAPWSLYDKILEKGDSMKYKLFEKHKSEVNHSD